MQKRVVFSTLATVALALFLSKNLFGSPPQSDPLDAAPSRFAAYAGARVHYKSLGDPAATHAVFFIHGWSCDLTAWRAQVPAFEGKARLLLLDLPGHGKSDRPDVSYSMEYFAGAVEAVMRDARVERALLVGHSMGTPVARQFYRKWPAKTIGIAAVDGALKNPFDSPAQAEKLVAMFSGPDFPKAMDGFVGAIAGPSASESVKADLKRMTAGATQSVAVSAMKGQFDAAIWASDPIAVPLAAVMARSPHWGPEYWAYVRTLNPSVEIVEIAGAGHFVMMEKPAEVNAALVGFAARAGAVPLRALRAARPEDVASPESIVSAVYDVISGPAGQPRDWDRFRSFFIDGARLMPTSARPAGDFGPRVLDVEGYVRRATPIFASMAFYEREVARRVERFGHIEHVFSTYESRHDPGGTPFARGINSFQLLFDGSRWWVVTIFWEAESEALKIPPEYLRSSAAPAP